MLILRTLGVLFILFGFAFLACDGTIMLATPGDLTVTSLREHWSALIPESPGQAQAFVENLGVPGLWSPLLSSFLALPASLTFLGLGLLSYWIGRRRDRSDTLAG